LDTHTKLQEKGVKVLEAYDDERKTRASNNNNRTKRGV
jgi:hypothetical protein